MIGLLKDLLTNTTLTGKTWQQGLGVMADNLETKRTDIKHPEVKKIIKRGDEYI